MGILKFKKELNIKKLVQKYFIFILILFSNLWIWRIFQNSLLIFALLLGFSFLIFYFWEKKTSFKSLGLICSLYIVLLFFQYQTTEIQSLTNLTNDEYRVVSTRKTFYKSDSNLVRIIFYRLNIPELYEGSLNVVISRLQRNFFETIDPNIYFFAGHPRERVWANDFEKFPFIYLPFFIIGLYVFTKRSKMIIKFLFLVSILTFGFLGHINELGPFLLIPFFVCFITLGLLHSLSLVNKKHEK